MIRLTAPLRGTAATPDMRPTWSAERRGPESPIEPWIAAGQMQFVGLEGLAGKLRPVHASLGLGMVAHVALATLLLKDFPRDVIDQLELPYAVVTGPDIHLCQVVGVSQRRLVDLAPSRYQPAPKVLEAVVGAAAMNHTRGSTQVPGVRLVEIPAERHLERYNLVKGQLAQLAPQSLHMSVRIVVGLGGTLNDLPELVRCHWGRGHRFLVA